MQLYVRRLFNTMFFNLFVLVHFLFSASPLGHQPRIAMHLKKCWKWKQSKCTTRNRAKISSKEVFDSKWMIKDCWMNIECMVWWCTVEPMEKCEVSQWLFGICIPLKNVFGSTVFNPKGGKLGVYFSKKKINWDARFHLFYSNISNTFSTNFLLFNKKWIKIMTKYTRIHRYFEI